MGVIAILLSTALLVLALAFGLYCLVTHCDGTPPEPHRHRESDRMR